MRTVSEILTKAQMGVTSIDPNSSVAQALEQMAKVNVGALMVIEGQKLKGVFSERDFTRKVLLAKRDPAQIAVSEVMTAQDILFVPSEMSAEECLSRMNRRGVRHLPVVDGQSVRGIVSILEVVNAVLDDRDRTIVQLESYVSETWPL